MSELLIRQLLSGQYREAHGDAPVTVPIRVIEVGETLEGREGPLVAALELGRSLAVVSDEDTDRALGHRVKQALAPVVRVLPVVLPAHPQPDEATVEALGRQTSAADALVAVGSGTINDLCKYAAARADKPYVVFATAPSMNGYTSMNASITVDGLKRTLPARVPAAVFVDLSVLAAAPARMIRAGVGDSLCRATAQADWLLAHLLRGDPYRTLPFELLAEEEARLLSDPEGLLRGDLKAMGSLARTLILSGLGMTLCGGSYPASQGEHLISHYVELRLGARHGEDPTAEPLHGEQIALTTLTMARLQRQVLERERIRVHPSTVGQAELLERYGPELGPGCWREFLPKRLEERSAAALNDRLAREWPKVREAIAAVCLAPQRVDSVLERIGAPRSPEALGWPRDLYTEAVAHAAELRNRYTFLDLARDSQELNPAALL
jgi:glycerol-1-phosphate dehydrogenase [NAD(P)+]